MFSFFTAQSRLHAQAQQIALLQSDAKTLRLAMAGQQELINRQSGSLRKLNHELSMVGEFLIELSARQGATAKAQIASGDVIKSLITHCGFSVESTAANAPEAATDAPSARLSLVVNNDSAQVRA